MPDETFQFKSNTDGLDIMAYRRQAGVKQIGTLYYEGGRHEMSTKPPQPRDGGHYRMARDEPRTVDINPAKVVSRILR